MKYSNYVGGMSMSAPAHSTVLAELMLVRETFHLVKYQKDG